MRESNIVLKSLVLMNGNGMGHLGLLSRDVVALRVISTIWSHANSVDPAST